MEKKSTNPVTDFIKKRWFSLLVTIIGIGGVVYYLIRYSTELNRLQNLTLRQIVILSILVIAQQFVSATSAMFMIKLFDIKFSVIDGLTMNMSSSLVNIIPMGAISFRAVYLKKVHGLRYVNYGLIMFCTLAVTYIAGGLMGIIGTLTLPFSTAYFLPLLLVFSAYIVISFIVTWLILLLKDRKKKKGDDFRMPFKGKIRDSVSSIIDSFDILPAHPKEIIGMFLAGTVNQIVQGFRTYLIARWLGYSLGIGGGFVLNSITLLVAAMPIPNNTLGLKELFTGFGAYALGLETAGGVIIAGVDRIVSMGWSIIIGVICLIAIRKKISTAEKEEVDSAG